MAALIIKAVKAGVHAHQDYHDPNGPRGPRPGVKRNGQPRTGGIIYSGVYDLVSTIEASAFGSGSGAGATGSSRRTQVSASQPTRGQEAQDTTYTVVDSNSNRSQRPQSHAPHAPRASALVSYLDSPRQRRLRDEPQLQQLQPHQLQAINPQVRSQTTQSTLPIQPDEQPLPDSKAYVRPPTEPYEAFNQGGSSSHPSRHGSTSASSPIPVSPQQYHEYPPVAAVSAPVLAYPLHSYAPPTQDENPFEEDDAPPPYPGPPAPSKPSRARSTTSAHQNQLTVFNASANV